MGLIAGRRLFLTRLFLGRFGQADHGGIGDAVGVAALLGGHGIETEQRGLGPGLLTLAGHRRQVEVVEHHLLDGDEELVGELLGVDGDLHAGVAEAEALRRPELDAVVARVEIVEAVDPVGSVQVLTSQVPSSARRTTSTLPTAGSWSGWPTTVTPSPSRSSHTRPRKVTVAGSSGGGRVAGVVVISSGIKEVLVVVSSGGSTAEPTSAGVVVVVSSGGTGAVVSFGGSAVVVVSSGGTVVPVVVTAGGEAAAACSPRSGAAPSITWRPAAAAAAEPEGVARLSWIWNGPSIIPDQPKKEGDSGGSLFHCQKVTWETRGRVTSPEGHAPGWTDTVTSSHVDPPASSSRDTGTGKPSKPQRAPWNSVAPNDPSVTSTSQRPQLAASADGPRPTHCNDAAAGMDPVFAKSRRAVWGGGSQVQSPLPSPGEFCDAHSKVKLGGAVTSRPRLPVLMAASAWAATLH